MVESSLVQVDPAAKVVSVLEKRADALLGGADDQFFLIKQRGIEPAALRFADHGANIVGMTILTKTELIKAKPDLVRRFVRASARSWQESKKNPGAAVDAALKVKSDLNRQSTLEQLNVDIELLGSQNSQGRIGWGAPAGRDQTLNLLKQDRPLEARPPRNPFHAHDLVAKGELL